MAPSAGGAFDPHNSYTWTGTQDFSGATIVPATTSPGGATGTVAASTVTAVEGGNYLYHQTVLTLTNVAMAISDTNVGGGTKIYTFPQGHITVLDANCSVSEATTSTIASTLKASKTLSVGIGSVQTTTQGSGTLVTTQQDICNAFACTSSATISTYGTAVTGKITATTAIRYDGSSTAQAVYLNCGVVTNTDIDADATAIWSGTVTITWVYGGA
jgi:hypothetical protein